MRNKRGFFISIHPLTWSLAAVSFFTGQFISFFILFGLIVLHECGHLASALFYKWEIKSVTLLPFGGKLEVEGILDRPFKEELVVIVSGPLQHIAAGSLAYLFLQEWSYYSLFMQLNIQLLCFNLLPLWPLDGGRIVYLVLARLLPFKEAVKQSLLLSFAGFCLTLFFTFTVFSFHLQWLFVLIYAATACFLHWKHRSILEKQFWLERWKNNFAGSVPKVNYIDAYDSVSHALRQLKKGQRTIFVIKEQNDTVAMVTDLTLIRSYFNNGTGPQPVSFLLKK